MCLGEGLNEHNCTLSCTLSLSSPEVDTFVTALFDLIMSTVINLRVRSRGRSKQLRLYNEYWQLWLWSIHRTDLKQTRGRNYLSGALATVAPRVGSLSIVGSPQ